MKEVRPSDAREPTIVTGVRKLAGLLAAVGVLVTASACGSSHSARVSSVRSAAYSGHLYSVREVKRAFAALGLELHRGPRPASGLVSLVNNARLGPQHIPSPPRVVTGFVVTRREPVENTQFERGRNTQVTRYANVTVVSTPDFLDQVRSAVSALRWGTASSLGKPHKGLIVLGSSIDGIRLGEPRMDVEKAFGVGRSIRRGVVAYFGGHLIVNYWFHDGLYKQVQYLETRWSGYRTPSGVHVGSSRRELRPLYVTCAKRSCGLLAGPGPDPVGTGFTMRHGKVLDITIGSFG
jgi:hypothetical protein